MKEYMIFVQNGKTPTKVHQTIAEAQIEANRLAKENPNRVVFIMETIHKLIGKVEVSYLDTILQKETQ